ncbi:hypothetical protein AVEN_132070-1 [Araneus ventricosus]|uniref:Uncharacterized protein n=1 Tax=Araneus ventricosus TaxID=182803 RepID=A0A4Y2MSE4_ARAVE|nr:hypothetical protein AVEN_132070-1 [Araneus ventricosus]
MRLPWKIGLISQLGFKDGPIVLSRMLSTLCSNTSQVLFWDGPLNFKTSSIDKNDKTRLVDRCLEDQGIERVNWTSRSPGDSYRSPLKLPWKIGVISQLGFKMDQLFRIGLPSRMLSTLWSNTTRVLFWNGPLYFKTSSVDENDK